MTSSSFVCLTLPPHRIASHVLLVSPEASTWRHPLSSGYGPRTCRRWKGSIPGALRERQREHQDSTCTLEAIQLPGRSQRLNTPTNLSSASVIAIAIAVEDLLRLPADRQVDDTLSHLAQASPISPSWRVSPNNHRARLSPQDHAPVRHLPPLRLRPESPLSPHLCRRTTNACPNISCPCSVPMPHRHRQIQH